MEEKGVFIEKTIDEFYGFDYEELEPESSSVEHPFDPDKIRIDQQMLSVKYLTELLADDQILLNPGFQRNKVWKERKRKSLLIESLMLRIPIPAFYFYENEDSKFIVIDGLQRLSTIQSFINDEFRLSGLEYLHEFCDGKTFSELDVKYQQRIYRTQLAVNILDARSPSNVVFDIFRRVNTGGVSLKPQEIRNAISKTRTRELLVELYNSDEFQNATHRKIKDDRMDGQELVLRFYAFWKNYDYGRNILDYDTGNIAKFLDEALLLLNKASTEEIELFKKDFKRSLSLSYRIFGQYNFRKNYLEGYLADVINKSLYTSWSVLLANPNLSEEYLINYKDSIIHAVAKCLSGDTEYDTYLTQGTNSTKAVQYSFYIANKIIKGLDKHDKILKNQKL